MEKYKVVCVGAGYFAKFHVEAWTRMSDVSLLAICDKNIEKAQRIADEYGVKKVYESVEEVYEDLDFDIIDIITPPDSHLDLCLTAISKGKHIICQKPLTPSFEEAKILVNKVNESGVRFMVHENFRFQPWYRKIKSLLSENAIGTEIFSINHRMRTGDGWPDDAYLSRQPYFREMPRLLIYETGIHFIDVFRYLVGDLESVFARLRRLNKHIKGEDAALIVFGFKNGCQGVFDGNRYNESSAVNPRYTFGEMLIEGSKGSIRLATDGSIFLKNLGEEEVQIEYHHENKFFGSDCVHRTQQHFINCLKSNTEFETNVNDYLKNLSTQEAVYKSHHEKKEIKIEC